MIAKKNIGERILIVAAHPDDEILGCGGTIASFVDSGATARIIFLAEGITARYSPEEFCNPDVIRKINFRNDNAMIAADIIGVSRDEVFISERNCCRLDQLPLIELVQQIEKHIEDFRPTRLFTHSSADPNVDHVLAHRAVLAAARPRSKDSIKAVYAFEILSSTEWNPLHPFQCNSFFDITSTIDRKVRALAAYRDEVRPPPHPRSEEVVRALARFRGAASGSLFAEGFQLIRSLNL